MLMVFPMLSLLMSFFTDVRFEYQFHPITGHDSGREDVRLRTICFDLMVQWRWPFPVARTAPLLLKVALDTLGADKVVALIGVSETFPKSEREQALDLAERLGARHIEVMTREMEHQVFRGEHGERCYHCKKELLTKFLSIAKEEGFLAVADGNNADDMRSSRAGLRAVRELGTHSPLADVGLTKEEVRHLSKELGLPTAVKPSSACLASRIPFGTHYHQGEPDPGREGGGVPARIWGSPSFGSAITGMSPGSR